jgi:hypothetical protein
MEVSDDPQAVFSGSIVRDLLDITTAVWPAQASIRALLDFPVYARRIRMADNDVAGDGAAHNLGSNRQATSWFVCKNVTAKAVQFVRYRTNRLLKNSAAFANVG